MAFESKQRISNAVEPTCSAMKFLLPSAAMHLEQEIAKNSAVCDLFWGIRAHCVLLYFCICVLRR
jgi:hypothetical protein